MSHPIPTDQRIRAAAFRALAVQGYANLSMRDIGAELGQNPSIIYHYFDGKDELLRSMLEVFVAHFLDRQIDQSVGDPRGELDAFVDQLLHPDPERATRIWEEPPSDPGDAVRKVYVELWAHAAWDRRFRQQTTEVESRLQRSIATLIRQGIEAGQFRNVDVDRAADHIYFLTKQGLHTQATTNRDDATKRASQLIDSVIDDLAVDGD